MDKSNLGIVFFGIIAVVLIFYGLTSGPTRSPGPADVIVNDVETGEKVWFVGDVKYLVDPEKILGGGPPKDGIPSIDNPKFISVNEADEWIGDDELVLAINYKGVKRVYPMQVMVWHEIVNDVIAGDPILITYCPLCGSGIAFERKIDGKAVEFGTSGLLHNSNLVMYDRLTDSLWQQIGGNAIAGDLAGRELNLVSLFTIKWDEWKKLHPESEVLSKDTGHSRDYGRDPYGSYYTESYLIAPVEQTDDRLHPKDPVLGIVIDGNYKAYREVDLEKTPEITDEVGGVKIQISTTKPGLTKIINQQDGKEIIAERNFWFSWYAFHPDTELYGHPRQE